MANPLDNPMFGPTPIQPSAQPIDPAIQNSALMKLVQGGSYSELTPQETAVVSRMSPDQINQAKAKAIQPKQFTAAPSPTSIVSSSMAPINKSTLAATAGNFAAAPPAGNSAENQGLLPNGHYAGKFTYDGSGGRDPMPAATVATVPAAIPAKSAGLAVNPIATDPAAVSSATPPQIGGDSLDVRDEKYIPPSSASGFQGADIANAATPGTNAAPAGAGAAMLGETGQPPAPVSLPPDIAQGKVSGPNLMKILSIAIPGLLETYGAGRLGYAGKDYTSMARQQYNANLQKQLYGAQAGADVNKELALLGPRTQAEASLQKSGAQAQAEGRLATMPAETEQAQTLAAQRADLELRNKLQTITPQEESAIRVAQATGRNETAEAILRSHGLLPDEIAKAKALYAAQPGVFQNPEKSAADLLGGR